MTSLADQIRARLASPRRHVHGSETDALLAVLSECEHLRQPSGVTTDVRRAAADRIESTIARGLGIEATS